jgi:hypothetical protein
MHFKAFIWAYYYRIFTTKQGNNFVVVQSVSASFFCIFYRFLKDNWIRTNTDTRQRKALLT